MMGSGFKCKMSVVTAFIIPKTARGAADSTRMAMVLEYIGDNLFPGSSASVIRL